MKSSSDVKNKIKQLWASYTFHKAWMQNESIFPYQIKLGKPTNKILLHQFDEVRSWVIDLSDTFTQKNIHILHKDFNFSSMGKQSLPVAIEFNNREALARYLGKWQEWQIFCQNHHRIITEFPILADWLKQSPGSIQKYSKQWPKLLSVCQYFYHHPLPDCYIRELDIAGVDTKFVETHKSILKMVLNEVLPENAIHSQYDKLSEHGFEKRFGLRYEQPRIHFRLLDNNMAVDFSGVTDLEIPIDQFAQLDLLCDHVFITENKTNGLAFPETNNALVIFGLGYGIQILKQVSWLKHCKLYYWGDIDTHGLAILSRVRHYFPKIIAWLMDEETLLNCKEQWGTEPKEKSHPAEILNNLSQTEQKLYHKLKTNHWQMSLRLEQEKIPYEWWQAKLKQLKF